ncbi:MAG: GlsB/YeaQ/YmgE family stress response membrane protein [Candidatus Zixiibacteriota bacterium]|jgi:uncharacterized membrane protein YeaQ/YmgE (transglycosylase-associated protein family)
MFEGFSLLHLVWFIIIGGFVGWLAGLAFRRRGFGCLGNVIVGIVGALFGGVLFRFVGWHFGGLIGGLFTSFVGAVLFLVVVGLFKKR